MKKEIMAPAGSFETLNSAIKAGADSVYFGVGRLNMRARAAKGFSLSNLKKIVQLCKKNNVKSYLTLNTVMYDEDVSDFKKVCNIAKKSGVSAIIACDFAVIEYANSIGLEVHLSTQANVSNIEAVKFFSKFVDVIVLARELSLKQIKGICSAVKKEKIKGPSGKLIQVEVFVHGALCVSISGKCYMSLATYNQSANRGLCLQNCRREYKITDNDTGDSLVVGNKFVMSPKDLCTIGMMDKLIDAGVSVFKIEGRGRKADYVYTAVKVYKEAVESVIDKNYTKKKIKEWTKELDSVYNRGFWKNGYYLGKKLGEWSGIEGSKATLKKIHTGKALNYYPKAKVGFFQIEAGEIKIGDSIIITGPTTGIVKCKIKEIMIDDKPAKKAVKGEKATIPIPEKIRENDKLLVLKKK